MGQFPGLPKLGDFPGLKAGEFPGQNIGLPKTDDKPFAGFFAGPQKPASQDLQFPAQVGQPFPSLPDQKPTPMMPSSPTPTQQLPAMKIPGIDSPTQPGPPV